MRLRSLLASAKKLGSFLRGLTPSGSGSRRLLSSNIRLLTVCASMAVISAVTARAQDWPQWGGTLDRNMASGAKGLPDRFDPSEKADPKTSGVKWSAKLGSHS